MGRYRLSVNFENLAGQNCNRKKDVDHGVSLGA